MAYYMFDTWEGRQQFSSEANAKKAALKYVRKYAALGKTIGVTIRKVDGTKVTKSKTYWGDKTYRENPSTRKNTKRRSIKGFIKCDGVRIRNGKIQLLNPGIYRIELMRIHLDRQGYTSFGKYFGTGAPVYYAEGQGLDQYLRANGIKEAKEKIIKYTKARVGPWEGKQIVFSRVN